VANDFENGISESRVATVANGIASAYSVRALRAGQYARYKHWRRSLLDGRAAAARPLFAPCGRPYLRPAHFGAKSGTFTKVELTECRMYSKFLSQQRHLANDPENCLSYTWRMELRQLTMNAHLGDYLFACGPKFTTSPGKLW